MCISNGSCSRRGRPTGSPHAVMTAFRLMVLHRPVRQRRPNVRCAALKIPRRSAASAPLRARLSGAAIPAWSRSNASNATSWAASPLREAAVTRPEDRVPPAVGALGRLAHRRLVDVDTEPGPIGHRQVAFDRGQRLLVGAEVQQVVTTDIIVDSKADFLNRMIGR